MRGLTTGRKALLAGLLGIVAAILAAAALLQLQSVNEMISVSDAEEPGAEELAASATLASATLANATREATESRVAETDETTDAPSERGAAPSGEDRETRSGAGAAEFAKLESEVRRISASHRGEYGVVVWQP